MCAAVSLFALPDLKHTSQTDNTLVAMVALTLDIHHQLYTVSDCKYQVIKRSRQTRTPCCDCVHSAGPHTLQRQTGSPDALLTLPLGCRCHQLHHWPCRKPPEGTPSQAQQAQAADAGQPLRRRAGGLCTGQLPCGPCPNALLQPSALQQTKHQLLCRKLQVTNPARQLRPQLLWRYWGSWQGIGRLLLSTSHIRRFLCCPVAAAEVHLDPML